MAVRRDQPCRCGKLSRAVNQRSCNDQDYAAYHQLSQSIETKVRATGHFVDNFVESRRIDLTSGLGQLQASNVMDR